MEDNNYSNYLTIILLLKNIEDLTISKFHPFNMRFFTFKSTYRFLFSIA